MADHEALFRTAGGALEALVREIVRDELRKHLGPEGDHLMNVRQAPMSARKLRSLVKAGVLVGFKHGHDTFIRASDFRAFIEGRPVPPRSTTLREPPVDEEQDRHDEICVRCGLVPTDPEKRRAMDERLARRRAGGGERAAALAQAEQERLDWQEKERVREERRARRQTARKRSR